MGSFLSHTPSPQFNWGELMLSVPVLKPEIISACGSFLKIGAWILKRPSVTPPPPFCFESLSFPVRPDEFSLHRLTQGDPLGDTRVSNMQFLSGRCWANF